mmetsp:Transcript_62405/g.115846  ORF Transcript_62405/g.115846 Transcript_62405/m.115846 type:complete len:298 (+) Transcript_62405:95-988(+)
MMATRDDEQAHKPRKYPPARKDDELRALERSAHVWTDVRMTEMQSHAALRSRERTVAGSNSRSLPSLHAQRKRGVDSMNRTLTKLTLTSVQEPPMARLSSDAARSPQGRAFHSSFYDAGSTGKSDRGEGLFLHPPQGLQALSRGTVGTLPRLAGAAPLAPATPPTPSRSYRQAADRTLQRLLLDMELDRQDYVGEGTHGLVVSHFDSRYDWFERHGKKYSRQPRPAPPYLQFQVDGKVMPGSMRIAQQAPSPALLRARSLQAEGQTPNRPKVLAEEPLGSPVPSPPGSPPHATAQNL